MKEGRESLGSSIVPGDQRGQFEYKKLVKLMLNLSF